MLSGRKLDNPLQARGPGRLKVSSLISEAYRGQYFCGPIVYMLLEKRVKARNISSLVKAQQPVS